MTKLRKKKIKAGSGCYEHVLFGSIPCRWPHWALIIQQSCEEWACFVFSLITLEVGKKKTGYLSSEHKGLELLLIKQFFSWTVESGQTSSRLKIAGDIRQVSASSAQTEQSCCVQVAAGTLLTGMFHAIKSDSALKCRLLMHIYPADPFQYCLFYKGKRV